MKVHVSGSQSVYPAYLALDRRNPLEEIRALPLAKANETFVLIPLYFLN